MCFQHIMVQNKHSTSKWKHMDITNKQKIKTKQNQDPAGLKHTSTSISVIWSSQCNPLRSKGCGQTSLSSATWCTQRFFRSNLRQAPPSSCSFPSNIFHCLGISDTWVSPLQQMFHLCDFTKWPLRTFPCGLWHFLTQFLSVATSVLYLPWLKQILPRYLQHCHVPLPPENVAQLPWTTAALPLCADPEEILSYWPSDVQMSVPWSDPSINCSCFFSSSLWTILPRNLLCFKFSFTQVLRMGRMQPGSWPKYHWNSIHSSSWWSPCPPMKTRKLGFHYVCLSILVFQLLQGCLIMFSPQQSTALLAQSSKRFYFRFCFVLLFLW